MSKLDKAAKRVPTIPIIIVLIGMILGTPFFASAQGPAMVRVNRETLLEGERVPLGSISAVSGPPEMKAKLESISLGHAPNVGMSREITRDQIQLAVRAAGFIDSDVSLESPASIIVRRSGQSVDVAQIRRAVEDSLLAPLRKEQVDARFVRLDIPEGIKVPTGNIETRVNVSSVRNIFAPFSVAVEIRIGGRLVRSIVASGEVEAFAEVFTAAKDISVGDLVADGDVRSERIRLERPVTAYVRDTSRLRGTSLLRDIRAGSALTIDALAPTAVIKVGDPVRIEAGSGKFRIIVNGEARAAGRIGDRIAVKNTQTGTVLQAQVIEKGVVRIAL